MAITPANFCITILSAYIFIQLLAVAQNDTQFIYNGFKGVISNLHLDGLAQIHNNGLLQLTDFTNSKTSHVFYSNPVIFDRSHLSFSTTYVSNPHKTHIVGTCGYLAPELIRKGRATTATDVFSFGITVLEVACGRSPLSFVGGQDYSVTDWVNDCWMRGVIVEASDPRLRGNYVLEEMKLVLKLGMLCSQPSPEARPKMRQVMQFLDGDDTLPVTFPSGGNNTLSSFSPSSEAMFTSYSIDSVLIVGR